MDNHLDSRYVSFARSVLECGSYDTSRSSQFINAAIQGVLSKAEDNVIEGEVRRTAVVYPKNIRF